MIDQSIYYSKIRKTQIIVYVYFQLHYTCNLEYCLSLNFLSAKVDYSHHLIKDARAGWPCASVSVCSKFIEKKQLKLSQLRMLCEIYILLFLIFRLY